MNDNEDTRTLEDLARNALDCQDACNLSGVIHSFSRDISRLRTLLTEKLGSEFSTDKLNRHAICILYSDKIVALSGSDAAFSKAYSWCKDITNST